MTTYDDSDADLATVTFEHDDDTVVVVIGSGPGGATVANELCQRSLAPGQVRSGTDIPSGTSARHRAASANAINSASARPSTGLRCSQACFHDSALCRLAVGVHLASPIQRHRDRASSTAVWTSRARQQHGST